MSYYRRSGWIKEGRHSNDGSYDSDVEYERHLQSLEEEYQKALAHENEGGNVTVKKEGVGWKHSHQQQHQQQRQEKLSSLSSRLGSMNSHCHGDGRKKQTHMKIVTNFVIGEKKCEGNNDDDSRSMTMDEDLGDMDVGTSDHYLHMMDVEKDHQQPIPIPIPVQHHCIEENAMQQQQVQQTNKNDNGSRISDPDVHEEQSERMEIDELYLTKLPLVVIDGANVAYAYAQAAGGNINNSYSGNNNSTRTEPKVLGIDIAVTYFLNAGCRVQVVIPLYWMRRKPNDYNSNGNGSIQDQHQIKVLQDLQSRGMLCCSPPADDDDAYCIGIARRIDGRFRNIRRQEHSHSPSHPGNSCLSRSHWSNSNDLTLMGGAYILSNDLYRDAVARDSSGDLRTWLEGNNDNRSIHSEQQQKLTDIDNLPRRISYSFCDLGSFDKYGDSRMDFVPNPRHPLIGMIERSNRSDFDDL